VGRGVEIQVDMAAGQREGWVRHFGFLVIER
jgi:hypothetical protein